MQHDSQGSVQNKWRSNTLSPANPGCRLSGDQKEAPAQGKQWVNLQSTARLCVTISKAWHPLPFCLWLIHPIQGSTVSMLGFEKNGFYIYEAPFGSFPEEHFWAKRVADGILLPKHLAKPSLFLRCAGDRKDESHPGWSYFILLEKGNWKLWGSNNLELCGTIFFLQFSNNWDLRKQSS